MSDYIPTLRKWEEKFPAFIFHKQGGFVTKGLGFMANLTRMGYSGTFSALMLSAFEESLASASDPSRFNWSRISPSDPRIANSPWLDRVAYNSALMEELMRPEVEQRTTSSPEMNGTSTLTASSPLRMSAVSSSRDPSAYVSELSRAFPSPLATPVSGEETPVSGEESETSSQEDVEEDEETKRDEDAQRKEDEERYAQLFDTPGTAEYKRSKYRREEKCALCIARLSDCFGHMGYTRCIECKRTSRACTTNGLSAPEYHAHLVDSNQITYGPNSDYIVQDGKSKKIIRLKVINASAYFQALRTSQTPQPSPSGSGDNQILLRAIRQLHQELILNFRDVRADIKTIRDDISDIRSRLTPAHIPETWNSLHHSTVGVPISFVPDASQDASSSDFSMFPGHQRPSAYSFSNQQQFIPGSTPSDGEGDRFVEGSGTAAERGEEWQEYNCMT